MPAARARLRDPRPRRRRRARGRRAGALGRGGHRGRARRDGGGDRARGHRASRAARWATSPPARPSRAGSTSPWARCSSRRRRPRSGRRWSASRSSPRSSSRCSTASTTSPCCASASASASWRPRSASRPTAPGPAQVVHTSPFLRVELASADAGRRAPARAGRADLRAAGIPAEVARDEAAVAVGQARAPRRAGMRDERAHGTVARRGPRRPALGPCAGSAVREAAAVARAEGAPADADATLDEFAAVHDDFGTSMQRDVAARPRAGARRDRRRGAARRRAPRHRLPDDGRARRDRRRARGHDPAGAPRRELLRQRGSASGSALAGRVLALREDGADDGVRSSGVMHEGAAVALSGEPGVSWSGGSRPAIWSASEAHPATLLRLAARAGA